MTSRTTWENRPRHYWPGRRPVYDGPRKKPSLIMSILKGIHAFLEWGRKLFFEGKHKPTEEEKKAYWTEFYRQKAIRDAKRKHRRPHRRPRR